MDTNVKRPIPGGNRALSNNMLLLVRTAGIRCVATGHATPLCVGRWGECLLEAGNSQRNSLEIVRLNISFVANEAGSFCPVRNSNVTAHTLHVQ